MERRYRIAPQKWLRFERHEADPMAEGERLRDDGTQMCFTRHARSAPPCRAMVVEEERLECNMSEPGLWKALSTSGSLECVQCLLAQPLRPRWDDGLGVVLPYP